MTLPRCLTTLLTLALFAFATLAFADHESMMGTGYGYGGGYGGGYDAGYGTGYGYAPTMPGMQMPGMQMSGGGYDPMNPSTWTGANDPMVQMEMLLQEADRRVAESWQNLEQAVAAQERFYIDYYQRRTGDTSAPYQAAAARGEQLWCADNPAQCQQMRQQNAAWAQQRNQQHQQNMAQLDANHNAWMAGQAPQEQAHRDFVQGVIWEESTWTNPQTGQSWSLPNSPAPGMSFSNGMTFNPATGSWSQNGTPLVPGN